MKKKSSVKRLAGEEIYSLSIKPQQTNEKPFPFVIVDCAWGDWSAWDTCHKTCNYWGTKGRNRTIIQAALNGGNECIGEETESDLCDSNTCPGSHFWAMKVPMLFNLIWILFLQNLAISWSWEQTADWNSSLYLSRQTTTHFLPGAGFARRKTLPNIILHK